MASDVKISRLVASTATYSRKAGKAADKNRDGKLTRTEARKLPKDLKDDFGRQVAGKANVSVTKFASDQAAYVARSARNADANHDGILSVAEQANMPADLQDNLKNFTALPAFKAVAVSQTLQAKVDATGHLSWAAQFKMKPAELQRMLSDPQANKAFFNHLLFEATGTPYEHDYPGYYTPDGLERLDPITQSAAASEIVDELSEPDTNRADFLTKARAVVSAVAGSGTKLYRLGWTNHDDASFDGVFAFDTKTGAIRAAGWYNEP